MLRSKFSFQNKFSVVLEEEEHCKKKKNWQLCQARKEERKKSIFFISFFYKLKKRKNGGNKKMRKTIFGFFSFEAKKKYSDFSTRLTLNRIEADPKRLFSVLMNKYYPKE